jgi:MATE family multidrug resistance protein
MTFQGASFGDEIVAANAVLMSFLMIISYAMDGFAYAMEAMVGKAIGAKDRQQLSQSLVGTFFWSLIICSILTLLFALFGSPLIGLITDIPSVHALALVYLPWLVAMPLVSMWCFLLDGIFIGATKGAEMRNGMFFSTCSFFAVFYLAEGLGNHALWMAMLSFMAMRGITLAVILQYQWRRGTFLA